MPPRPIEGFALNHDLLILVLEDLILSGQRGFERSCPAASFVSFEISCAPDVKLSGINVTILGVKGSVAIPGVLISTE